MIISKMRNHIPNLLSKFEKLKFNCVTSTELQNAERSHIPNLWSKFETMKYNHATSHEPQNAETV